jgi:hypothetical protein
VGIELVDEQNVAVPGAAYRIAQANAPVVDGTLDADGKARVSGFAPGPCEIAFPDFDPAEWMLDASVQAAGQLHTIQSGEHLAAIAAERGLRSFTTIWDHPKNAELKALRKNPHVLEPGDVVFIPKRGEGAASRATGAWQRFTLRGKPLRLRLKLLSIAGEPLADTPCTLTIDGVDTQVEIDAEGLVELVIPATTRSAVLLVDDQRYDLVVGGLDPIDTPAGLHARLRNLGYDLAADDEGGAVDPDQLRFALELFQHDHHLPVTGEADQQTKLAMERLAGC